MDEKPSGEASPKIGSVTINFSGADESTMSEKKEAPKPTPAASNTMGLMSHLQRNFGRLYAAQQRYNESINAF